MADKYGPIFTLRLGVHKTLVVSNWEMAKQCFTVNDKAFASRPKSVAFEVLGYNFSMIGFSPVTFLFVLEFNSLTLMDFVLTLCLQ